jgi:hypothetical protein
MFDSSFSPRFKGKEVKDIIHAVLLEELGGKSYDEKESDVWCSTIVDEIQSRVTSKPVNICSVVNLIEKC